ncbi:hypothetical protein EJ06DRAFT_507266 [Trichodelitschia bisporula]|uniref:MHD domain-containing protein n=1 Tax=Trichodelitschia bisporula TaxID=703511 RepID=A0A6G1I2X2_9PEZI|nr:hypothetical protein EJ06DRAFT_507266 [Trichodelitschia bisporula]
MDLSRQEYPSILAHLNPSQSVKLLNDRLKHINKLNTDIADWLQERRRLEESYANGLRKLAQRQLADEGSDLGIFTTPWQKIISSLQATAESHYALAQNIEADVERPLRDFAASNRDVQAMNNITSNLQTIAKDFDSANRKAEKLREKGGKAAAGKVATAASDVESAQGQWESQAPYVFERLQAVDESRVDHLRNLLTQYQTHVIESTSTGSNAAEACLNALLNVQTADEIKTFAMRFTQNRPSTGGRQRSAAGSTGPVTPIGSTLAAPSPSHHDDDGSQRSSSFQDRPDKARPSFGGLKRLGTVIGRRRQSTHPYGPSMSPERKKSSSNIGNAFGHFGKKKEAHQPADSQLAPPPAQAQAESSPRPSDSMPSPELEHAAPERVNGTTTLLESVAESDTLPGLSNGTQDAPPKLQEPLQPTPAFTPVPEPAKSAEAISPPSGLDAMTAALDEAAALNESSQPSFKLDIRNAPIEEEDADASVAVANVANALRAQAAPRRNLGTVRGRRDRNTILVMNTQTPVLEPPRADSPAPNSAPLPASVPASSSLPTSPATLPLTPLPLTPSATPPAQQSQFKLPHRPTLGTEDHTMSDTHSIRSGRSVSSSLSTIKHPDMHDPGLNASIVETVSTWFKDGVVTRTVVLGELALAYNPADWTEPLGTDTIRLENFSALEKVAPNPAFIEAVPDSPGSFHVTRSNILKTAVAFKYQVRLSEPTYATYAPILITSAWKVELSQASVLLHYSFNPAFADQLEEGATSVTLSDVVLMAHLDPSGARSKSCKSMNGGIFARERNMVYWRLGEVTLTHDEPAKALRARFFTETEAKPGNVEARWTIPSERVAKLGTGAGLGVSTIDVPKVVQETETEGDGEADPFADEGVPIPRTPVVVWKKLEAIKRWRSGTYVSASSL